MPSHPQISRWSDHLSDYAISSEHTSRILLHHFSSWHTKIQVTNLGCFLMWPSKPSTHSRSILHWNQWWPFQSQTDNMPSSRMQPLDQPTLLVVWGASWPKWTKMGNSMPFPSPLNSSRIMRRITHCSFMKQLLPSKACISSMSITGASSSYCTQTTSLWRNWDTCTARRWIICKQLFWNTILSFNTKRGPTCLPTTSLDCQAPRKTLLHLGLQPIPGRSLWTPDELWATPDVAMVHDQNFPPPMTGPRCSRTSTSTKTSVSGANNRRNWQIQKCHWHHSRFWNAQISGSTQIYLAPWSQLTVIKNLCYASWMLSQNMLWSRGSQIKKLKQ